MSNTLYIDINAKNSVNLNASNNRFQYRLPEAMTLPTGTEIGMQSSILNLKGITGASVELQEDFVETVIYQYYAIDTTYASPVYTPLNSNLADVINYNLICDLGVRNGITAEFGAASTGYMSLGGQSNLSAHGYSENPMPLITQLEWSDGTFSAVPCLGKSVIRVPKGVYSINKLAEVITNQITTNTIPADNQVGALAGNFYKYQKLNNLWHGYTVNNSTCRNFIIQTPETWAGVSAGTTDPNTGAGLEYLNYANALGALDFTAVGSLNDGTGLCTVLAVTPNTANQVRANAQAGGFGPEKTVGMDFASIAVTGNPNEKYRMGFEKMNKFTNPFSKYGFDSETFNPFLNGLAFGTSGFELKYDLNNSGYSISKLHEPRRLPTVDRFGVAITNAGKEVIYDKVMSGIGRIGVSAESITTLNAAMSRISGIAITNWSFDTAYAEGDRVGTFGSDALGMTDEQKKSCCEYANYSAFFTTPELARKAWEKTLWFRLGFQYDEIQNDTVENAGGTNYNWFQNTQLMTGFTTNQNIDESITPQISTIFNPLVTKAAAEIPANPNPPQGETPRGALNAVSDVQYFNLEGINIPYANYNNDLNNGTHFCTAPYQSSFYKNAIMAPVITTAKDFTANELPTLSENGYVLVTSDIVEPTDVIKNQQSTGILDLIPKSNLSNQDYIADRNIISHTLSNPKTLNEISIAVLNPDMTDIQLQPDSSFLLRVSLPVPKPTNLLSNAALDIKNNEVTSALGNMVQRFTDPQKSQTNLRVDIDNSMGLATVGNDGLVDNDINQIEAIVAAAGGLPPPPLPADPIGDDPDGGDGGGPARLPPIDPLSYRSPRFNPSLPAIEEAPLEPVEGAWGRVGVPTPARRRELVRHFAREAGVAPRQEERSVARARTEEQQLLQGRLSAMPDAETALEALRSQLDNFTEFMRDPRLRPREYREAQARRNIIEQAIQRIEASGVLPQAQGPPPSYPQPPSE